jgi:hypothetical protein
MERPADLYRPSPRASPSVLSRIGHGPIYLDLAMSHAGEAAALERLDALLEVEARALAHPPKVEIAVHGAA